MLLRCHVLVLLLVALLGAPRALHAAETDPAAEARRLWQEGDGLRADGDLPGALTRYRKAYALIPSPVLLLKQARIHLDLGDPRAGRRALHAVDPTSLPPEWQREHALLQHALAPTPPASDTPVRTRPAHPAGQGTRSAPEARGTGTAASARTHPSLATWPAPPGRGRVAAKWVLGILGGVAIVTGATLWALDGRQGCDLIPGQQECPRVWNTAALGISLVACGTVSALTAGVLAGLDARRDPAPVQLTLRF